MRYILALLITGSTLAPSTVEARNILITNDDGLTSNVVALHKELRAAGHDVLVSVPCINQSGMGAALQIGQPLPPLSAPCLNNAAQTGSPAVGPMTREGLTKGDFFYVAGTPVMAVLYGLDVAAVERWGRAPDLVLSGPNEGQNVGAIILSSGTFGAAQFAAMRGLPTIAVSAGANTTSSALNNPLSTEVAYRLVELITALDGETGIGQSLLPEGLLLNMNFPDDLQGARWRLSEAGSYNAYKLVFTMNMAENASPVLRSSARERGMEIPPLPGVNFYLNRERPRPDEENDESIVYRNDIAITPFEAGYGTSEAGAATLRRQLGVLLSAPSE